MARAYSLHVAFYMHDLASGGVEKMRLALIAALRSRGVRVSLVLGRREGRLLPQLPADLRVVDLRATRTLREIPRLVRYLREERPDILISSLDHNNIAAMLARMIAGAPSRLVICQHNALSAERQIGWKYWLVPVAYRLLHRSADAVVAVSRGVANDLCAVAGLPRRKIAVIYNPVLTDDQNCSVTSAPPHPWLADRSMPVFVYVGRLTFQKDVGTLLRALQGLLAQQAARLIIVGEGEQETSLRETASSRNLDRSVAFVGYQPAPMNWVQHADALIVPSRYEGLGNVIIEALACGTQVIATDCPHGPAEILLEGALGTLVPVGDAPAMAAAMAAVSRNRIDPSRLIARAACFTAEACAEAHLGLFDRILDTRGAIVPALGMMVSPDPVELIVDRLLSMPRPATLQLVVTPNLDHVRLLQRREFAGAYQLASFVCPDGLPVLAYARLRGLALRQRVTGCALLSAVMRHARAADLRFLFVVESEITAVALRRWVDAEGRGHTAEIIVAPAGLAQDDDAQGAIVERAARFIPNILVMTLGAPVSEEFVFRYRDALPACWVLSVGQALRVELGLARRAPLWFQRTGFEWLWRIVSEPRRLLSRYVHDALWFPIAILRDVFEQR